MATPGSIDLNKINSMNVLNFSAVTHPFKSWNALRNNDVDNLNEQRVILDNIDVSTISQDMVIEDKNELDMTEVQSYPVSFEPVQEPEVVIEVKNEPNVEIKDEPDLANSSVVNFEAPIVSCPFNFEPVPEPDVDIQVKVEPDTEIKDEPDITSTSDAIFQEHSCPVHLDLVSEPDMVFGNNEELGLSYSVDTNSAARSFPDQLNVVQEPCVVIKVKDEPGIVIKDEPDVVIKVEPDIMICSSDADFEAPSSNDPVNIKPVQELHVIFEIKDKADTTSSSGNTNFAAQSYPVQAEPVQMLDSDSQTLEHQTQTKIVKMGPRHFSVGKEKIVLGTGDFGPTETRESRLKRERKRMEEIGSCFYKCGICNEEFSNAMELQIHVQLHNGYENELIVCSFCDKVFTGKTGTFSHLRHVHGIALDHKSSTIKTELLLPWVQKNSENISTLSVQRVKKLDCNVCGTQFTSLEKYKLGETVSNETLEEEKIHKEHLCGKCNKDCFQNLNTRRKDGKIQYECAKCRRFFFKPLYDDHIRSLHGLLKLFECNVCGKRCVSRPSLRSHIKSHKKEGTFN